MTRGHTTYVPRVHVCNGRRHISGNVCVWCGTKYLAKQTFSIATDNMPFPNAESGFKITSAHRMPWEPTNMMLAYIIHRYIDKV